jgi:transcriptional/translational regulatory protein YebC/TACO1
VTMRAGITTPLDRDDAEKMIRMLETLEDLDDVQNVYSNADIADDILAEL